MVSEPEESPREMVEPGLPAQKAVPESPLVGS